jgi:hypothetical protein
MQSELDNLREILRGEGYSIDANTLLGVSNFEKNVILFLLVQLKVFKLFECFKYVTKTQLSDKLKKNL